MRTLHSILKHGGLFWDRELLPPENYTARYGRIQETMRASGDDAWLVFGDVARYGNLTYLTNFLPRVRSAMAYLPREGAPVLYASIGLRDIPAAKTLTWVDEIRVFGRVPASVAQLITDEGLAKGRIGLVGFDETMPVADWDAVAAALPDVDWQVRSGALDELRARKDTSEIAAMRAAGRTALTALEGANEALEPGTTMRQVFARLEGAARGLGAEDVRILAASGPQTGIALGPIDDRVLEAGDPVMVHFAVERQRYWAEVGKTFTVGGAGGAADGLQGRAQSVLAAMEDAATPGASIADLAAVARAAIGDGSLAEGAASYGFAHGIGLDAEEYPLIASHDDAALAPGAALALRAVLHGEGTGAIAGRTVLIGDDGLERLT
ncbi:MAG: M24 family metallopeptidase [Alphaproteobacteria bacterium]|nr:M24 family metallopeptidase [Alphaproteobacteria bacterium]